MERIVVSLGGNAIVRRGERGTIDEQFENARVSMSFVARMAGGGRSVVITHGNGPIVGNIVLRVECAKREVPPMPLYICDADSEGGIGFVIQQTLHNELRTRHHLEDVVTVVTQVVVDRDDRAFAEPTKPIGPYYDEREAGRLERERGWVMAEVAGGGFRRLVPSPAPLRIVETAVIEKLASLGVIVIAAGGGGVPVVEEGGLLRGVEAVVDKDLATSVLAVELGASRIVTLTEVDAVYLDFGKPSQLPVRTMTAAEARRFTAEGHFAPGSMRPKVEAAVRFVEATGGDVIITAPELVEEAVEGRAGTRIVA
ncbi:MAG TPA: carbamate kinase [Deltaproteobacteria bacterium]|nr:carbamate kinase [Deltaproteobacteria bacterium]